MSTKFRLVLAGLFFFLVVATGARAACETERAALNRCEIATGSGGGGLPSCPAPTCVPKCHLRMNDGSCASYEINDFCGINPSCSARCHLRMNDGSCASYEISDVCTESKPRGC